MPRSPLFGRRIHIAGSIVGDPNIAKPEDVNAARKLVSELVGALVKRGATFVVPVDAEPTRPDGFPICFDWLIWETLMSSLHLQPKGVPAPLAVAIQHHKTEDQIPTDKIELWDALRSSALIRIENAAFWNMSSKRMEAQAKYGDILITLGGTEGVLHLANLYHDAGKPVIPLNMPLCPENAGSRRLYDFGMISSNSSRFFQISEGGSPHDWLNRIRFPARQEVSERVENLVELLVSLERPRAFAVRLLNDEHEEFRAVQDFFNNVVEPIMTTEFGYQLTVIDGKQSYEHSRIDQEIFAKLHRSSVVIADLTGGRPNCFLELGYALGRGLPTIVTARSGSQTPFDITTFAGLRWNEQSTTEEQRRAFREHWQAVRSRPSLVPSEGLIQ